MVRFKDPFIHNVVCVPDTPGFRPRPSTFPHLTTPLTCLYASTTLACPPQPRPGPRPRVITADKPRTADKRPRPCRIQVGDSTAVDRYSANHLSARLLFDHCCSILCPLPHQSLFCLGFNDNDVYSGSFRR